MTYPPPEWNATDGPFRDDVVAVQLVVEAARRAPEAPAIVGALGTVLTYGGLLAEATRLARLLQSCEVGCGDHVAFVGRRDARSVIALLGAALAGAAFVPVSPEWPVDRTGYVLSSTRARCLVGAAADLAHLDQLAATATDLTDVVLLDVDTPEPPRVSAAPVPTDDPPLTDPAVVDYGAIARAVLALRPRTVLQVGIGTGDVLRAVAPHVDLVGGIDPDAGAVAAATSWADSEGWFVDLVQGDVDRVATLLPGTVDAAVLPGPALLHAVASLVRPGGAAVLPGTAAMPPVGTWTVEPTESGAEGATVLRRTQLQPDRTETGPRVHTAWHVARQPAGDLSLAGRPGDVAYVIFTSGSTGRPKGVTVSNDALVNMLEWCTARFAVGPADRMLQVTSFCFDLSIYDVFGVLSAGGALRIADEAELAEPARLARVLLDEPITFWNSAPPMFAWVLPFLTATDAPLTQRTALRLMFLAGDWIPVSMPDETRAVFPNVEIVSYGGATETAVWSCYHVIERIDPDWPSIPYGRPLPNTRYYILDEYRRPAAIDEVGDIYTAGTCLALGYHGDPAQTAERFVPDPFRPGQRMYFSGDRGRWRPSGDMQFLGRVDHQVKIRGYRVELGEIESVMGALDSVRSAAVVAVDVGGSRALAGFYTCREPGVPVESMRATLAKQVPEYMVPGRLVCLDELPLTANGKIDRASLAALAAPLAAAPGQPGGDA